MKQLYTIQEVILYLAPVLSVIGAVVWGLIRLSFLSYQKSIDSSIKALQDGLTTSNTDKERLSRILDKIDTEVRSLVSRCVDAVAVAENAEEAKGEVLRVGQDLSLFESRQGELCDSRHERVTENYDSVRTQIDQVRRDVADLAQRALMRVEFDRDRDTILQQTRAILVKVQELAAPK